MQNWNALGNRTIKMIKGSRATLKAFYRKKNGSWCQKGFSRNLSWYLYDFNKGSEIGTNMRKGFIFLQLPPPTMVGPSSVSHTTPLNDVWNDSYSFPVVFSYKNVQSSWLLFKTLIFNLGIVSFPSKPRLGPWSMKSSTGEGRWSALF